MRPFFKFTYLVWWETIRVNHQIFFDLNSIDCYKLPLVLISEFNFIFMPG